MIDLAKSLLRIVAVSIILAGCRSNTVFEGVEDFDDRVWPSAQAVRFEFEIEDAASEYDMSFHIRYTNKYPFQNIYIQHYLEDSTGDLLQENLNNILLFDPVTGIPVGSGLGDINTVEKVFAENVRFGHAGTYRVRVDHFMRMDSLPEVVSAGYSIVKSGED